MLQSSGYSSSSDAKITAETERDLAAPPQSSTISGKIIWLKANSQNDGSKKDNLGVINYILKRTHTILLVSTICDIEASRQLTSIVTM